MFIISVIFIFLFIGNIYATNVGEVFYYKGRVDILKKGEIRGLPIQRTDKYLAIGDILRTKSNGYAKVSFIDENKVEVYPNSRLIVLSYEKSKEVNIRKGIVKFEITRLVAAQKFTVKTNTAIIGVKGTTFWVYVFPFQTLVMVEKGTVELVQVSWTKQKGVKKVIKSGQVISLSYKGPPKIQKIKDYQRKYLQEKNITKMSFTDINLTPELPGSEVITPPNKTVQSSLTPELTEDPYSFAPPPTKEKYPSISVTFQLP